MTGNAGRHLLLVHAHPDDESIGQGATMARYVAEGVGVTLVTCTGGEMGEILVPELEHLAADQDDTLADQRRIELDKAMAELGVTDHRYLGGFKRYRDSGMQWHADGHAVAADNVHDNAFWNADLTEAANDLVAGDPRGPAAGAGHLRRVRRLRPPRPHPGPPGGDVRRRAGCRPVLPARPRRAPGTSPRSTGAPCPPAGFARASGGCATAGDATTFEGMDPDGTCRLRDRGRRPDRGDRRLASSSSRRWPRCGRTRRRSPSTGRSSR